MINILYIGNTPLNKEQLDVNTEEKAIEAQCIKFQDKIAFDSIINPTLHELMLKLRGFQPQVIHFGGYTTPDQQLKILTNSEGELIGIKPQDFEYIISAFEKNLEILILNASYSLPIAQQLSRSERFNCIISFKEISDTSMLLDYITPLYHELLRGEPIKDAVVTTNISAKHKLNITWNHSKKFNQDEFRLTDPNIDTLQEGNKAQGKTLIEKIGQDHLSSIWYVSDGNNSKIQIRRFLDIRVETSKKNSIHPNIIKVRHSFTSDPGVLTPGHYDLNCDNPYIEYNTESKVLWKPLSVLISELEPNYPLNKAGIDEVNSIVFQLAQIIDTAHHSDGGGIIHGFLNPQGIIVVDKHSSESATFGNLRPIITDYGLSSLFSRNFKNTSPFISPWTQKGNNPRKAEDTYALICLWYWLLTGKEPVKENINQIYDWYAGLKEENKVNFEITKIIKEIYYDDPHNNYISSRALVEVLRNFLPESKLKASVQVASNHEITNSIGMKFSYIEGKNYIMGSALIDIGFQADEKPRRLINLKAFYMSQCVLTIENLIDIAMASNNDVLRTLVEPLQNKKNKNFPATTIYQDGAERKISWQMAKVITDALTALPEEQKLGYSYFLPTEAQWEIACRAETSSVFNTGLNELSLSSANFKPPNSQGFHLKSVKSYPPNRLGLYEMHGNVWEFCQDYYHPHYDLTQKQNPKGFQPKGLGWKRLIGKRFSKVIRGGDFQSAPNECRSANRSYVEDQAFGPTELHEPNENQTIGIRLVCYTVEMTP